MLSDSLLTALGGVTGVVLLLVALYIYGALTRQIAARGAATDFGLGRMFGIPEAVIALGLIALLLLNVVASFSGRALEINTKILFENLLFTVGIVLFIAAFLIFRGFDLNSLAGFSKISLLRAVSTGIVLLLAAYPLIALADTITRSFLDGNNSKQSIVELFNTSQTLEQRIVIIVFAVAIAPVSEEFMFRFFLYGALKRYFGRFFGVIFNALLFGAVHTHLPSFAPLFVLGICFTIAYEWSGSILVSMTMHSIFNALSLTLLAFPELFPQ